MLAPIGWWARRRVTGRAAGSNADGDAADPIGSIAGHLQRFIRFCTADPVRYQLLFQRTIPGFEPPAESCALAVEVLEQRHPRLRALGIHMETVIDEIAPDIYRMSTYVPDAGMTFNQILVNAEEPLLFHCGMRALFPNTSQALGRVVPIERLRWISFGHTEADECGAMNQWLAAAPRAEVAFGTLGCAVSVNDLADRPPGYSRTGRCCTRVASRCAISSRPHLLHGWDAGVFFEEATSTLLCGDLFTATGEATAHPPCVADGRSTRPGRAPVCSPSSRVTTPFTMVSS
ncbi:hypothetical protein [Rhabdothermincola sediminis]|uniref:hypothetical protein n=1 Tax=Rhabdothermincola sediminis TaxID=2751370 RepID=UPI001AA09FAC|nr:hypothetical protein [Rhabdothermincola sediminis]